MRSRTLVCSSLLNTFSLSLSSSAMRSSSSSSLCNAAGAISGATFLAPGATPSLASHLCEAEDAVCTMADTFGDKAAHPEKTTAEASAAATAASATAPTTSVSAASAELGSSAACLEVEVCRITAARQCSSFLVHLCACSDHRAIPASGTGLRVRHALLRRKHEEAVKDLVVIGVCAMEGRHGPRRGQQVTERG